MKTWHRYLIILLVAVVAAATAFWYYHGRQEHGNTAQARIVVAGLGDNLQKVPLVASKEIVAFAMDQYYAFYVHPDLLAKWKADPLNAPGRLTSSPWPDRIDVKNAVKNADGTFTVDAEIVEIANGASGKQEANRIPVRFVLTLGPDGWQITDYKKL